MVREKVTDEIYIGSSRRANVCNEICEGEIL